MPEGAATEGAGGWEFEGDATPNVDAVFQSAVEVLEPSEGEIEGEVPECINGMLLRVGPGKFDFDNGVPVNHFFDGYSMLSKYTIKGGQNPSVTFQCKYLDSDSYKKAMAAQKPMHNEYGTKAEVDPDQSYFSRLKSIVVPNMTDNCIYNYFTHGRDTFVSGETSTFHELDVATMSSKCKHDTSKYFGFYMFSAHPLHDTKTGYTYNIGTSIKTGLKYNILRIPPKPLDSAHSLTSKDHFKKNAKTLCSISSRWNSIVSFNHSFGMSKNYIIFIEQPYVINVAKFLSVGLFKNEPLGHWLEWHPSHCNRFHIVEKETGKLLKTEILSSSPFFFLHVINCYEDNNQIVVDVGVYDDPHILQSQTITKLREGSCFYPESTQAAVQRFVLPIVETLNPKEVPENSNMCPLGRAERHGKSVVVYPETIVGKGLEMIALNPRHHGYYYEFGYAASMTGRSFFEGSCTKINFKTKEVDIWRPNNHTVVGECVFVPRKKNATRNVDDEDDGFLIVPTLDLRDEYPDFMYFLNAKTMEEVGRVKFDVRLIPSLHGHYLPADMNNNSS